MLIKFTRYRKEKLGGDKPFILRQKDVKGNYSPPPIKQTYLCALIITYSNTQLLPPSVLGPFNMSNNSESKSCDVQF